jgi:hypothetical protein
MKFQRFCDLAAQGLLAYMMERRGFGFHGNWVVKDTYTLK